MRGVTSKVFASTKLPSKPAAGTGVVMELVEMIVGCMNIEVGFTDRCYAEVRQQFDIPWATQCGLQYEFASSTKVHTLPDKVQTKTAAECQ
jgi:hypothetical protein